MSIIHADFDTAAQGPITAGFMVIGAFFGALGVWSATAPLNGAAIAPGVVTVAANRQAVQHQDGGVVKALLVKEGDRVAAGQVLLRLDDTSPRSEAETLQGRLDALLALRGRLTAERDGAAQIAFDPRLTDRAGDPAVAALMTAQRDQFEARRRALDGQIALLRKKGAEFDAQIVGHNQRAAASRRQRALVEEEADGTRQLYGKGFAAKTKVLALDRSSAELGGQVSEHLAEVARLRQSQGETELQIMQLGKDSLAEVSDRLHDTETELLDVEPRLRAAKEILARTEVRAPVDGTVVALTAFTVGGVIKAGEHIGDVVPKDSPLVVDARLRPEDVQEVAPGARAEVHLSAYKMRAMPILHGTLTRLSADRLSDARTDQPYYELRVEVDRHELEATPWVTLYPGMPAEVMVPTRTRTALDYLLAPLVVGFDKSFREI